MINMITLTGWDFLTIIIAALLTFPLGYLWYSDILFGPKYRKELGVKDKGDMKDLPFIMAMSMLLTFITAIVLAMLIGRDAGFFRGAIMGAVISLAFVVTSFGTTYLYEKKSLEFFLINSGYNVACFVVMGIVFGLFL